MSFESLGNYVVDTAQQITKDIRLPQNPDDILNVSTYIDAGANTAINTAGIAAESALHAVHYVGVQTLDALKNVLGFAGNAAKNVLVSAPVIPVFTAGASESHLRQAA